jgi:hypothetical protein
MALTGRRLGPVLRCGSTPAWRFTRQLGLAMAVLGVALLAVSPAAAAHPAAPASSPATPATAALICLAAVALPVVLASRQWRRSGIVVAAALLVGLAAETAIHSAHHLNAPAPGERCPAASASQHLTGLDPEPGVPLLDRPAAIEVVSLPTPVAAAHVVLDGEHARAPPALPA